MNNDLISREALKKEIMECMTSWDEHSDYGQGRLRSYEWAIKLIDNAPTVFDEKAYSQGYNQGTCDERANQRTDEPIGTWIEENVEPDILLPHGHRWRCPICEQWQGYGNPKHCPNCGADMRGDSHGQ